MKQILSTNRLVLSELNTDNAEDFYRLNLNPSVLKYTGDLPFENIREAREFLQNYADYQRNGYGRWAVTIKGDTRFIGWCGLKFDETSLETDIGFRFFQEEWNKGYATESALACLAYGFGQLGLKRIIGRVVKANTASIRVLEKIGLEYERDIDFEGRAARLYKIEK